jgi:3-phosphoshikimate 1-carboxyvinyltransferase
MAVLAAVADGVTELVGISRARLKESNRVFAARQGLERMGIEVREEPDRLKIRGSVPRGAVIDSHGDHRVAMAFTALGLRIGNTVVQGAECVSKTFPDFWEAVRELGGRVVLHE